MPCSWRPQAPAGRAATKERAPELPMALRARRRAGAPTPTGRAAAQARRPGAAEAEDQGARVWVCPMEHLVMMEMRAPKQIHAKPARVPGQIQWSARPPINVINPRAIQPPVNVSIHSQATDLRVTMAMDARSAINVI